MPELTNGYLLVFETVRVLYCLTRGNNTRVYKTNHKKVQQIDSSCGTWPIAGKVVQPSVLTTLQVASAVPHLPLVHGSHLMACTCNVELLPLSQQPWFPANQQELARTPHTLHETGDIWE